MFRLRAFATAATAALWLASSAFAQLADEKADQWTRPTGKGPDKDVPGWLINLGPTGARAMIRERALEVRYVFPDSPAHELLLPGDEVIGIRGKPFQTTHKWGRHEYGYDGPMMEFGHAVEHAEATNGKLRLLVRRPPQQRIQVTIPIERLGAFGPDFPFDCAKSQELRKRALAYLVESQAGNGSWGPVHATAMGGLAMIASGEREHMARAKRVARMWGSDRTPEGIWSWNVAYRLIFLSEYYLATREDFVLPAIDALLRYSEAMMHPEHGGFGHKVQPEGYGPMVIPTSLVLAGWELAATCGRRVDPQVRRSGLRFVEKGTGLNGYVCYGTEWVGSGRAGAGSGHIGRTGASVLARALSSDKDAVPYVRRGGSYLGQTYKAFADGHAENMLGAAWAWIGCAAADDPEALRSMLDYCKSWFNLARNADGSFVALPGRDYAGGGSYYLSSRNHLTATMALVFALDAPLLRILGNRFVIPGVEPTALSGKQRKIYRQIERGMLGTAWRTLERAVDEDDTESVEARMLGFVEKRNEETLDELVEIEHSGDLFTLKARVAVARKRLGGVPDFDEQHEMWTELFRGKKWRKEVAAGSKYHGLVSEIGRDGSARNLRKLELFQKKHRGTKYADAAKRAIELLKSEEPGDPGRAYFRERLR